MKCLKAAILAAALSLQPLAALAATPAPSLSAADQADLARVEAYLNSIRTVHGQFMQSAEGEVYAEGAFYIERPGKMRIQYATPNTLYMVASGSTLSIYDPRIKKATYVPVDATPAYYLFKDRVGFGDGIAASKLERGEASLRVTIYQMDHPNDGRITLVFSDKPLELKKWKMIDHDGNEIDISLVNTEFNTKLDPNLFKFVDPSPTSESARSGH